MEKTFHMVFVFLFLLGCSEREKFTKLKVYDSSSKVVLVDNECLLAENNDPNRLVLVLSNPDALKEMSKDQLGQDVNLVLDDGRYWKFSIKETIDSGIISVDLAEVPIFDDEAEAIDHLLDIGK